MGIGPNPLTPAECAATFVRGVGYIGTKVAWSGLIWSDGGSAFSAINTCLPPNSPQCAYRSHTAQPGFYTASSRHAGGVNVVMADGSVHFVSENIDAGNQGATPVTDGESPYGVWGKLGSKQGGEIVEQF